MTARDKRRIANVLKTCITLEDADRCLQDMFPDRYARFGLFDGWAKRPESLEGFSTAAKDMRPGQRHRYRAFYLLGRELSAKFRPRGDAVAEGK